MLSLAIFMQTLLDAVPVSESFKNLQANEDEDDNAINMDTIKISTNFEKSERDYELPKGGITRVHAKEIAEVYRSGGRLSLNSVQKILRVSYKALKQVPNSTRVTITGSTRLNVVGDIHGQIADLLHILDEAGEPGPKNKYIFNGDFVDRGTSGIEVICLLLALHAAHPESVILNRGNHEDHTICTVYGFQRECKEKYDELTFGMFAEVFRFMPLFAVINDAVLVIHGGLFHRDGVTLDDLDEIDRTDYVPKPQVPYPQCTQGLDTSEARKEYLKQLQRDALWSDPEDRPGRGKSVRGAGVHFGPDVTKEFLQTNELSMIVRSHECVRSGFERPYSGENAPLLCTIFSASNYSGGNNDGAYLVFTTHELPGSTAVPLSDLWYYPRHYKTSEAESSLEITNITSLQGFILKKRSALQQAFMAEDTHNSGMIPKGVWAEIMARVTEIQIRWLTTLPKIANEDTVSNGNVLYEKFLQIFSTKLDTIGDHDLMDSMYAQRGKLEAIFNYFDRDGNGTISREEFQQGCVLLNQTLPPEQQLTDYNHILDLMDFDHSDSIDINEFFEVFRILDAQDGQVDGVISMASVSSKK